MVSGSRSMLRRLVRVLTVELDGPAADVLQRPRRSTAVECGDVEVGPLEPDDLAAAHAGVRGEVQRRVEPLRLVQL